MFLTHKWDSVTSITTPGLSGPGSNGNEGVVHIPQTSRTEASYLDAVRLHIKLLKSF